ncbi:MAG TPA: CRTAC1 family protein, partial [Thermoanaerobaculia bacterium]|nr:CRTAC1 family protein [Thermoanaerobaculia bacterium]
AGPIRFQEVSEAWGLAFEHRHGGTGQFYMPETMAAGLAVFDYDGDGDEDVFFVESGALGPPLEPGRSRLFRNDGRGPDPGSDRPRFVDVTESAGLRFVAYGMGAAAGDVDGDADPDLYVTAFGPNQLFRNRGDGTFEDVTAEAGVGDPQWSASAAFADTDRDGDLDLYVASYVDFALDNHKLCGKLEKKVRSYCHPDVYNGLPDRFFRNRGPASDGPTFEDATAEAGFAEATGKGLGVVFGDVDGDGWPDLYVANDMTANFLFMNRGDGTFQEVGVLAGVAFDARGEPEASMGVDMGDVDGDGGVEIVATHLDLQTNALYSATGAGIFIDRRYVAGIGQPSYPYVGFGVAFADLDRDGDRDLVVANGHIIPNLPGALGDESFRQRNQVFAQTGTGRFTEVKDAGLTVVESSRGMGVGDLDGDGDLDLAITNSNARSEVYENRTEGAGHGLAVDLLAPSGNRRGIGAKVTVESGGRRQAWEVRTGASYLSQSATTLLFGLGEATRARLEVVWPDGFRQVFEEVAADRRVRVERD